MFNHSEKENYITYSIYNDANNIFYSGLLVESCSAKGNCENDVKIAQNV